MMRIPKMVDFVTLYSYLVLELGQFLTMSLDI